MIYFQRDFGNVMLVIAAEPGTLVQWEILDRTTEKPGSILLSTCLSCICKHNFQHLP